MKPGVKRFTNARIDTPGKKRRLPAPWTAEKVEGGYRVKDDHGHWLAFVYAKEDHQSLFWMNPRPRRIESHDYGQDLQGEARHQGSLQLMVT